MAKAGNKTNAKAEKPKKSRLARSNSSFRKAVEDASFKGAADAYSAGVSKLQQTGTLAVNVTRFAGEAGNRTLRLGSEGDADREASGLGAPRPFPRVWNVRWEEPEPEPPPPKFDVKQRTYCVCCPTFFGRRLRCLSISLLVIFWLVVVGVVFLNQASLLENIMPPAASDPSAMWANIRLGVEPDMSEMTTTGMRFGLLTASLVLLGEGLIICSQVRDRPLARRAAGCGRAPLTLPLPLACWQIRKASAQAAAVHAFERAKAAEAEEAKAEAARPGRTRKPTKDYGAEQLHGGCDAPRVAPRVAWAAPAASEPTGATCDHRQITVSEPAMAEVAAPAATGVAGRMRAKVAPAATVDPPSAPPSPPPAPPSPPSAAEGADADGQGGGGAAGKGRSRWLGLRKAAKGGPAKSGAAAGEAESGGGEGGKTPMELLEAALPSVGDGFGVGCCSVQAAENEVDEKTERMRKRALPAVSPPWGRR